MPISRTDLHPHLPESRLSKSKLIFADGDGASTRLGSVASCADPPRIVEVPPRRQRDRVVFKQNPRLRNHPVPRKEDLFTLGPWPASMPYHAIWPHDPPPDPHQVMRSLPTRSRSCTESLPEPPRQPIMKIWCTSPSAPLPNEQEMDAPWAQQGWRPPGSIVHATRTYGTRPGVGVHALLSMGPPAFSSEARSQFSRNTLSYQV